MAAGEYGTEYLEKMVNLVENGSVLKWYPPDSQSTYSKPSTDSHIGTDNNMHSIDKFIEEINPKLLKSKASWGLQFRILVIRMLKQMWRDKVSCVIA